MGEFLAKLIFVVVVTVVGLVILGALMRDAWAVGYWWAPLALGAAAFAIGYAVETPEGRADLFRQCRELFTGRRR